MKTGNGTSDENGARVENGQKKRGDFCPLISEVHYKSLYCIY